MPIEVRELVIKATVVQEGANGSGSSQESASNNSVSSNEQLIHACVEKVLEILKEKHDR